MKWTVISLLLLNVLSSSIIVHQLSIFNALPLQIFTGNHQWTDGVDGITTINIIIIIIYCMITINYQLLMYYYCEFSQVTING